MTVLERLEQLRTEATPGRWYADDCCVNQPKGRRLAEVFMENRESPREAISSATLIAETHNALPALLRIARAAETVVSSAGYAHNHPSDRYAELRSALSDLEANT